MEVMVAAGFIIVMFSLPKALIYSELKPLIPIGDQIVDPLLVEQTLGMNMPR